MKEFSVKDVIVVVIDPTWEHTRDPQIIGMQQDFCDEMRRSGVEVIYTGTEWPDVSAFTTNAALIGDKGMRFAPNLVIPQSALTFGKQTESPCTNPRFLEVVLGRPCKLLIGNYIDRCVLEAAKDIEQEVAQRHDRRDSVGDFRNARHLIDHQLYVLGDAGRCTGMPVSCLQEYARREFAIIGRAGVTVESGKVRIDETCAVRPPMPGEPGPLLTLRAA
jgi:hypothetical protein